MNYTIASTKSELKKALDAKSERIIITNSDLASNIRVIKAASNTALTIAIAAVGVTATNIWNPVGWGAGLVGVATSGTLILAIAGLGIGTVLIWSLVNGYTIKAKSKIKLPDGTTVEAELILEKK